MAKEKATAPAAALNAQSIEQPTQETQLVAQETSALVEQGQTSAEDLFAEDAGMGMEGVGANDYALPFMTILQKGSPQVSRANAKYIKDANSGMIMNTVNANLTDGDEGLLFIPCGFQKKLVHWTSRDSGGGFLGHIAEGDPILKTATTNERGQLQFPDGTVAIDTAYHFGLSVHEGGFPEFAIVSMYSTGLKVSRNWNTVMRAVMMRTSTGKVFNPPTFSHMYRLTTIGMQKDNYDWFSWKVLSEGVVSDPSLYKMAKQFSEMVAKGQVRVSKPTTDFDGEGAPEGVDPDKVPF